MDRKETVLYLERAFNRARKEMSGKGALKTKVTLCEDVIFVKLQMDFSGLSKRLFRHLAEVNEEESYYKNSVPEARSRVDAIIGDISSLKVIGMHFKMDIENDYSFATIVLNGDLEEQIQKGNVVSPPSATA